MERAALLHRPESEYAYLYEKDIMHVRLRTKKDDVKEVAKGYECGLNIKNFNDIKEYDIIEAYETVEVKKKLK